jgi:inorganic pyrophosphatase/exopolyphosphatase
MKKEIYKLGSCCTRIIELISEVFKDDIEKDIAFCLLTVVLLDTYNFSEKMRDTRWNARDFDALKFIISNLEKRYQIKVETDNYFKRFENLQFDEKLNLQLGVRNLFNKDLKDFDYKYGRVSYSVFYLNPKKFIQAFDVEKIIDFTKTYTVERKSVMYVLLFCFYRHENDSSTSREVLIYSEQEELIKLCKKGFADANLKLENRNIGIEDNRFSFFVDETATYTRKIIEPVLAKIEF